MVQKGEKPAGFKAFDRTRDKLLKRLGFSSYAAFTDAVRAKFQRTSGESGFKRWHKARDAVIKERMPGVTWSTFLKIASAEHHRTK